MATLLLYFRRDSERVKQTLAAISERDCERAKNT